MTDVKTQNAISLKGSAQLVKEFFRTSPYHPYHLLSLISEFGLNSILYQRGLYPSDSFKREKRYGLTLWVTHEKKLLAFLEPLLQQVECEWRENGKF